jgi:hypothetical protein
MSNPDIFIPIPDTPTCLEKYVARVERKLQNSLPSSKVASEIDVMTDRLTNLTSQLSEFIASQELSKAWLVLGKVQSGKTQHLLGTLAYAATKRFALASLFTGINEPLNEQGIARMRADLSAACVEVRPVPTLSKRVDFNSLKSDLIRLVGDRIAGVTSDGEPPRLPVLVTMKNPKRVEALTKLVEELQAYFPEQINYLLIDDEADQASQNGAAQKRDMTATYEKIAELRASGIRHAMLAYTATPQAVLLSEKTGFLRPDRCVTVRPKSGYFGLDDFTDTAFAKNLIEVDDVEHRPTAMLKAPDSLTLSIAEFFVAALLRNKHPDVFYADSPLENSRRASGRMTSVQLMIHESSAVKEHTAMYKFVGDCLEALLKKIDSKPNGPDVLQKAWRALKGRLGAIADGLPLELGSEETSFIRSLIETNQILVVNADKNNPTPGITFPVRSEDWEAHKTWILIGGDILGRGLTIEQLIGSYFLRHSKKPNFDTVSQQMRFCGYRKDYARATFIRAHVETINLFKYMQKIEAVVWRYAEKWDKHRMSLTGKLPPIMYAAPLSANLEPTRKNVRDPNLLDLKKQENSELLFSARMVFNPQHVFQNINNIRDWFEDVQAESLPSYRGDWTLLEDLSISAVQKLIPNFISSDNYKQELRAIAGLFEREMGELGLSDRPVAVYLKSALLNDEEFLKNPENAWDTNAIRRALHLAPDQPSLPEWKSHFKALGNSKTWGSLKSPHIGEGQRALKRRLKYDGTVLVIEPVIGLDPGSSTRAAAYGIAFSIFKPKDFEVRMIGHS